MKIGLDFDGVICQNINFRIRLPEFLFALVRIFIPAVPGWKILRQISRQHRIVIVSSRTSFYTWVTKIWFWRHGLSPVVYCVGKKAEEKARVLQQEQVDIFFDDKPRYVEAAKHQEITAYLFQGWTQVAEILRFRPDNLGFFQRLISSSKLGRRLKKRLLRWVTDCPECSALWQEVTFSSEVSEVFMVNKESVNFRKLTAPLTVYHATSRDGAETILVKGLAPSADYTVYADKANKVAVSFAFLSLRQARRWACLTCWPLRLVFDFRTSPKTVILEIIIPAGSRVGLTSWNEVILLDL